MSSPSCVGAYDERSRPERARAGVRRAELICAIHVIQAPFLVASWVNPASLFGGL